MTRTVLLVFLSFSASAGAATYYVAPQGADTQSGASESEAWGTLAYALSQLNPGDTLMLADGRYEAQTTGLLAVDCSVGIKNGAATQPIVVRALHERQAWLASDGVSAALNVIACSYWQFVGLRVSSSDKPNPSSWFPVSVSASNNIELRRLLVTHNNRFVNSHLLDVFKSQSVLIEESEFYWFSRAAVSFSFVDGGVVRRSYANSRGYLDIDAGFGCCDPMRGDIGFLVWDTASDIRIENSVSEGQTRAVEITSIGGISAVNVSGSISLNESEGARVLTNDLNSVAAEAITFEQFVAAAPSVAGLTFFSTKNGRCTQCSILGSEPGLQVGLLADRTNGTTGNDYSTSIENTLVTNVSGGPGISVAAQATWAVRAVNAFKTDGGFYPLPGNFSDATEIDPNLGACMAYLPQTSSMRGRGLDGGDIGADILYRYQDGVQTCEPLWDSTSGAFPCGAAIPGVNDLPGSSCSDVHLRLHVGAAECPLPVDDGRCSGSADGGRTAGLYTIGCACTSATDGLWLGVGVLLLRGWRGRKRPR